MELMHYHGIRAAGQTYFHGLGLLGAHAASVWLALVMALVAALTVAAFAVRLRRTRG